MNTLSANFKKIFDNVNSDINDVKTLIPLSTSQLVNDSNYTTEGELSGKQDKITNENKLAYDLISGAPAAQDVAWGSISGTLSSQTDLQDALSSKASESDLIQHVEDTNVHVTSDDRNIWDSKVGSDELVQELENYVPLSQYGDDMDGVTAALNGKEDTIDANNKVDWQYIENAPTIPSSTSQLTNDSNFITEAALSSKQDKITNESKLAYSLISGTPTIPTKTSDLTNDSGFATSAYVDGQLSTKQDSVESSPISAVYVLMSFDNWQGDPEYTVEAGVNMAYSEAKLAQDALSGKQDKITSENKLNYDLISGAPTNNGVFQPIIEQNGNGSQFVANYAANASIIKYVGNAASGVVSLSATGENSVPSGNVATVELQVPVSGEVTTITIPSAYQQINIPETLEATSGKITYHDFVFRAEKDSIAGTMRQYVNYAYSFTEDAPEPPPTITFNDQTMSFNSNTSDNIQLSYTDSAVGETVSAEIVGGTYPNNFTLYDDSISFDGYATSSGSYPIIVKLSSEGTPKGVSAVVTLNVTMNQITMPATQSASMDGENTWFTPDYSGTPEWPNLPAMTILSGTLPTGVDVSTEGDFGFSFYPETTVHETQTLAVQIYDGDGTSLPASGLVTLICDYDAPTYQLTMTSPQQGTITEDGGSMILDYGGDPDWPEFIPNMTVLSGSLPEGVEVVEGEPTFMFTPPDPTQDVMDSSTVAVQLTDPNGEWLPCSGIVEIAVEYYAPEPEPEGE